MKHWNWSLIGRLKTAASFLMIVILALILSGCGQVAAPQATALPISEPTATLTPVPTELPTSTATVPPSATPEPSSTPTLPPTATEIPPLAVLEDGFSAWCVPQSYAGIQPTSPDAPFDANLLTVKDDVMQVKIPAGFCTMSYRFNQALPADLSLVLFDNSSAFLKIPLKPVDGRPEEGWASVSHDFVVNPPFWEVTYRLAVLDPQGQELWSEPVKFAKPLPTPCQFGGLPDPITLYCTKSDPLEIEPHPDITWPWNYTRVPSDN